MQNHKYKTVSKTDSTHTHVCCSYKNSVFFFKKSFEQMHLHNIQYDKVLNINRLYDFTPDSEDKQRHVYIHYYFFPHQLPVLSLTFLLESTHNLGAELNDK